MTDKKPTIIKEFPSQAVEEYRLEHGHLPTTDEPCIWDIELITSLGVIAKTEVKSHTRVDAVTQAMDGYFQQFPQGKVGLKSVVHRTEATSN